MMNSKTRASDYSLILARKKAILVLRMLLLLKMYRWSFSKNPIIHAVGQLIRLTI